MAGINCMLVFLIPPACEKYDPDQDSIPYTDEMVATPRAATTSTNMYWGPEWFSKDWPGGTWIRNVGICTSYLENFGNFVLKVQNMNNISKISVLEIRINNVLILTAKGLAKDYFASKNLRSLSNCATLTVTMEGDQGCTVKVWIEGTFKGLGAAYGKHLYYKSVRNCFEFGPPNFNLNNNWYQNAREYCHWFGGHLVIINNSRENDFVWNLCKNGGYFMGLSDFDQDQLWQWVDGTWCRIVNWNWTQCPGGPSQGWGDCLIFTDYGYNNWHSGEPNNDGGGWGVAVFNEDGTWNDVAGGPGGFVIEWEFIPTSGIIHNLFTQEHPDYQYPW